MTKFTPLNALTNIKKNYAKPRLIRRGTVLTMTKGTSGSDTDGFGGSKSGKGS